MIRRRGNWWFVAGVVSERGKMLTAVLALCCCVRLVAATPTEALCPEGFYNVEKTDLCCELCKPGQFVENRCTENNGPTTCRECPNGYYTAVENYLPGCWKCKKYEDVDQLCTGTSNALCRCKSGFHKADGFCVEDQSSSTGMTPGSVAAVVILVFLIPAAGVAMYLYCYRKRNNRNPWRCSQEQPVIVPVQETSSTPEMIRRALDEHFSDHQLVEEINGRTPKLLAALQTCLNPLLNELRPQKILTNPELDNITAIAQSEGVYNAATRLLDIIYNKGHRRSRGFWDALSRLTVNYPKLLDVFAEMLPDGWRQQQQPPASDREEEDEEHEAASGLLELQQKAPGPDANVQCSTAPGGEVAANEEAFRRLTACSDEQLLDGITTNMTPLVEAIEGDEAGVDEAVREGDPHTRRDGCCLDHSNK
ncbi:uncharacterized protein LOC133359586 isoform X2 [Lethenteron reissneri]|uniref:uncharacterized protein LOC133359586 isoform X2 n=1 Tax=Lethenteron reissneri TaxID=7753 RepID=UPI002AB69FB1|nr:uncharacterized protein LOC133359586 isoform X2 [Lethenteron reissneri]